MRNKKNGIRKPKRNNALRFRIRRKTIREQELGLKARIESIVETASGDNTIDVIRDDMPFHWRARIHARKVG